MSAEILSLDAARARRAARRQWILAGVAGALLLFYLLRKKTELPA